MPDIFHDFPIAAPPAAVFAAMTTPPGLNAWWTLTAEGASEVGHVYQLGFGPGYDWQATVRRVVPDHALEWEMTQADADWQGTHLGFSLTETDQLTWVHFYHTGWPQLNEHYRISSYCWAMYLRLLKRYVEFGEVVAYADRLAV